MLIRVSSRDDATAQFDPLAAIGRIRLMVNFPMSPSCRRLRSLLVHPRCHGPLRAILGTALDHGDVLDRGRHGHDPVFQWIGRRDWDSRSLAAGNNNVGSCTCRRSVNGLLRPNCMAAKRRSRARGTRRRDPCLVQFVSIAAERKYEGPPLAVSPEVGQHRYDPGVH
jgi:hypothetical protein